MSGASKKSFASWTESFGSDGFAVCVDHFRDGERFRIVPNLDAKIHAAREVAEAGRTLPVGDADARSMVTGASTLVPSWEEARCRRSC